MTDPIRPCEYTVRISGSYADHCATISDISELPEATVATDPQAHPQSREYDSEYLITVRGSEQSHNTFTTEVGQTANASVIKTTVPARIDTETGTAVDISLTHEADSEDGDSLVDVFENSCPRSDSTRPVSTDKTALNTDENPVESGD